MTIEDAALETLFLPFTSGALVWPVDGQVLFMRAREGAPLHQFLRASFICEQSFRPFADKLRRAGLAIIEEPITARFPIVLVLPPRQRDEARALLARAFSYVAEDGMVIASMLNTEGARSGEADLAQLAGPLESFSKHKCRVFWVRAKKQTLDANLVATWAVLDAPRPIDDGRFLSRPGLFAWDRIDAASTLLARNLPPDLAGRGADLGAGFGYLSTEVVARCRRVTALDLYEAEARALALARLNLAGEAERVALNFFWHDVTTGLPQRYDFIVTNPPFHQGRTGQPELGRNFITAAASALLPGGRLWVVANRHLPYEAVLNQCFGTVRTVVVADGFKVIEAVKANA